MLEYENQILLDILHEDGLVVCAKGLSVENVFTNLIKVYCDPGNLVIILSTNVEEEQCIINELESQNITPLPKIITSEHNVVEREHIYEEGGVYFISSRIVVVDLLKHRLPIKHITGFLIWRAHKILNSYQDAFALRLYRLENKVGFIKAFSSSAGAFTHRITGVERMMKSLFVRNLYLWPRFHAVVHSNIEKHTSNVVELHIQLTGCMFKMQMALLHLIRHTVSEIKRLNPTIDTDDVTVENVLSTSFHKLLKVQLDPMWNQLSSRTKNSISDLKILRHLLLSLYEMDCVKFYSLITSLKSADYVHRSSGWMLLDKAEELFVNAKVRLGNSGKGGEVEPHPKWEILGETLKEIRQQSSEAGSETVLILVKNIETCRQLKKYLTSGIKELSRELYQNYMTNEEHRNTVSSRQQSSSVMNNIVATEESQDECFTLTQSVKSDTGDVTFTECSQEEMIGTEPIVVLQHYKTENHWFLPKLLNSLNPRWIVIYDVSVIPIRQIEVYQARHPEMKLTVFTLMFEKSTEEQAFLTSIRREKVAFDYLIKEKTTMVIPIDQDGKSGECSELTRNAGQSVHQTTERNTRKGGSDAKQPNPIVIVDMREFRSELPVLLHRRGIDIEPVTITVGDYILTPDICVERKSVNDLIGSLNSGRLYQQVQSMTRHYAKPILLIEFDPEKAFGFGGNYYLSKDVSSSDMVHKLQLLTLYFPKLRILWSSSPHCSAQLFHEMKEGKEQPNVSTAMIIGQEEGTHDDGKYNSAIKDFLSKLPGITTQNIYRVLNKCKSIQHLSTLSQREIEDILQSSSDAENMYNALHADYKSMETQNVATVASKPKYNYRAKKKKFNPAL